VLEHARLFAKLLDDPHFEELTDKKNDEFHVIYALTFGVDSAIARNDRGLADALFDRWIGRHYPTFDDSAILLHAWQKLMLFRGDGVDMARECLDPENDFWPGFASRSFPVFIALAQGSAPEFSAHVDAEVRSADDQFAAPPTKVSFLAWNPTILLGMAPASDARLAQQYGLPTAPSWLERYDRWGSFIRHDP
jgi:hypothetical protein